MIKILVVEDQTLLRETLLHVIGEQPDMEVVGSADDAAKAPELCRKLKPNLVLMDVVTKNNSSGIVYASQIIREFSEIKIVVMTALPEITFINEAKKAGVHSFLYKNTGNEHLYYVIRSTMKGAGLYPGPSASSVFPARFTERELSVIRLVCLGMTRSEIVRETGISESTVKQIITSILDKTGFDNIMRFAVYAVSQGLIAPGM